MSLDGALYLESFPRAWLAAASPFLPQWNRAALYHTAVMIYQHFKSLPQNFHEIFNLSLKCFTNSMTLGRIHSPNLPYSRGIGSLAVAIPVLKVVEREKLSRGKLKCTAGAPLKSPMTVHFHFRPSGPMLSISRNVHMFVCVCVFTFEVPFKRLFGPTS